MRNAATLRHLGLIAALVATVAACGGAGAGPAGDRNEAAGVTPRATTGGGATAGATGGTDGPTGTGGAAGSGAQGATGSTPRPATTAPSARPVPVDTKPASDALAQLDALLNATDAAISAEATAAISLGE